MPPERPDGPNRNVLVCADVLGAFGLTPADVLEGVRGLCGADAGSPGDGDDEPSVERALSAALEAGSNRTATVRELVSTSPRGIDLPARYAAEDLLEALASVFEGVGWSLEGRKTEAGVELEATNDAGRVRETAIEYPDTPLGEDNLPAVLAAVNDEVLFGVDARFVLLSSGVGRWRAALLENDDLATLRERYAERVRAFDRPLLPDDDLDAHLEAGGSDRGRADGGPWPAWALEGAAPSRPSASCAGSGLGDGRAEPAAPPTAGRAAVGAADSQATGRPADTGESGGDGAAAGSGLVLSGGSPSVSRVRGDGSSEASSDGPAERRDRQPGRSRSSQRSDRASAGDDGSKRTTRETSTAGFGTLRGSAKTARVSNESFGAGVEQPTDDDRYRALGAAIGTGRNVSVKGLLEDEEFLPELPAADPVETRIDFEDEFDPGSLERTRVVAEESGFEWVDSGALESTRMSDG